MLLKMFTITMAVINPRIIAFHLKHDSHGAKIKGTIDQGFTGRFYMQVTCDCGVQKELPIHGFKVVDSFVEQLQGIIDPRKK